MALLPVHWLRQFAVLLVSGACAMPAHADDAQIILLLGRADYQATPQTLWQPAAVEQLLPAGTSLRTSIASQLALLLRDQTQIRMNEQTQLRVTSVASAQDGTTIELSRGRLWAQARQYLVGPLRSLSDSLSRLARGGRPPLMVTTPTSTIGIRGTDWEVVAEDDRTVLTVLSGEVEIRNDQGELLVGPNEQAVAVRGQAPTKVLLSQARDRVQWVTAYRPSPRRWAPDATGAVADARAAIESGDYAAALPLLAQVSGQSLPARLLQADLLVFLGRAQEVAALLAADARDGTGDPVAVALQARALMVAGRLDGAGALLARAATDAGTHPELLLARADLARLGGEATAALALFQQVVEAFPARSEGWFGLGRIHNEKEDVRRARAALDEALRLEPEAPGYPGERATVETLAGNLARARTDFEAALARAPSDYVAWTGLGILQLKAGEPAAALQSLLKAGLLEPRFARAQLYTGVAYYQLGSRQRALESVQEAARTDPRDPLPQVMLALMRAEARQLGASIDAAREAQLRLPYLKSLNQLLNDQKGSANLGASLAAFGMEEWATFYANAAYSPYWAGSHLFLADRQTGEFNKNSELFKGFITDPTVFGASDRFSTLVTSPGHHGRLDLYLERKNWGQGAMIGTVNGLVAEPLPLAYLFSGDLSAGSSRDNGSQSHGNNQTLGLGARPRHDIGVFAFGTNTRIATTIRNATLPEDALRQHESRGDVGLHVRPAPDNQFWFKTGAGQQQNLVSGSLVSPASADALTQLLSPFAPFVFTPVGTVDRFSSSITQHDAQFRQTFSSGAWIWSWGVEQSRQTRTGEIATTFDGAFGAVIARTTIHTTDRFDTRATDAYLVSRYRAAGGLETEGALFAQRGSSRRSGGTDVQSLLVGAPPPFELVNLPNGASARFVEVNPRLGIQLPLAQGPVLRVVGQQWRRPGSAGTLAPIDTLGIVLNDRLPMAGGLYQRARVQLDAETSAATFLQAFADAERVDNGLGGARNTINVFEVTQLQTLRNRQDAFSPQADLENTPVFGRGVVHSLGLAANHRWSPDQTLGIRYLYRDSRQGGDRAGLAVPYHPRHMLRLGSHWVLSDRWLLGTTATYRGLRFRDDANQDPIRAGWAAGFTLAWESEDKRVSVQAILDNLLSRTRAGDLSGAQLTVRLGYRF